MRTRILFIDYLFIGLFRCFDVHGDMRRESRTSVVEEFLQGLDIPDAISIKYFSLQRVQARKSRYSFSFSTIILSHRQPQGTFLVFFFSSFALLRKKKAFVVLSRKKKSEFYFLILTFLVSYSSFLFRGMSLEKKKFVVIGYDGV